MVCRATMLTLLAGILVFSIANVADTAEVSVTAELPRVLLIGDSISIGYTEPVRARLEATAEVHALPIAAKTTTRGLAEIDRHLGKMRWDVIHFNWGLNDLEHAGSGKPRVPLELYEKNLRQLVNRLKRTSAVLVWASTTPVPEGSRTRTAGDAVRYNAVATEVMRARNIPINDLHAFALARLAAIQKKADVHFTEAGSALLAEEVARHVRLALAQVPYRSKDDSSPQSHLQRIDIGRRKQLLVDDYVVAERDGVTREVGQATKYGIVMKPTLPTDFQTGKVHDGPDGSADYSFGESAFCWFFSPHWDPGKKIFRLWYEGSKRPGSGLAYAESRDGTKWTKPLISKDGKSNLVNFDAPVPILRDKKSVDLRKSGIGGTTVTIDPNLPYGSREKYKLAFYPNRGGQDGTTRLGYSADGINWSFYNKGLPVTGRAADFNNQVRWDPLRKRYLLLCREDYAAGGGLRELRGVRIMEHAQNNDLMNHPTAWRTLTKFVLGRSGQDRDSRYPLATASDPHLSSVVLRRGVFCFDGCAGGDQHARARGKAGLHAAPRTGRVGVLRGAVAQCDPL